jgi:HD-GYP domain-containing protein (c-di-GMP phosphodiesterase class II)
MTTARPSETAQLRLAEIVAALSLGVDLGFGQPMEHVLRQCVIALQLADRVGLDDDERAVVYYSALLLNVGCHSDAHEQAKWFGDDIRMKSTKYEHDIHSTRSTLAMVALLGSGNPPLHRFRVGLEFALHGHRDLDHMIESHSALARRLATELGLPVTVQAAVGSSYEQWDGKGWPGELSGADVPIASRIVQLAEFVEVAHRVGGIGAAVALADKRSGSQFDPELASILVADADAVLGAVDSESSWEQVIASEPALCVLLDDAGFEAALLAVADFVDLKSPFTLGHARNVSALAAGAATQLGLDDVEVTQLRRAGLVHDLGRLGVSNSIWDKPGPLGAGEWERIRMHPYLTQRMLRQARSLAPLGTIAAQHRERLDGSGYPAGLAGPAISQPARILAVADAYQSMRELRPYRAPLDERAAADELAREVKEGRLDRQAVDAVLSAAGHAVARRSEGPAGLTRREIEVLQLLARGRSAREIATELVIAPKTARNHIEHIYTKIGATNRVAASLFAVQHGLIPDASWG